MQDVSRNFIELFLKPDHKSTRMNQQILYEMSKTGDLGRFLSFIRTNKGMRVEDYTISIYINEYTSTTNPEEEKQKLIDLLKSWSDYIKRVDVNQTAATIETNKGIINVRILSDIIPELKDDDCDIQTGDRIKKCHQKSLEISNRLGIPNEVVTGYVYGISDKLKWLHSWVECDIEGNEYVIDYTMNALINREGYYMIKNAEPLSRISNKNLANDKKIINKFAEVAPITNKEYLVFRDEIMRELEKNKKLFDDER